MTELEPQLRELGARLEYPPTPDVAAAVRARLEARPPRRLLLPSRRTLAITLAVLAVAAGAVMAVPPARTAILEWLGIKGVEIERAEKLPPAPTAATLGLGERVSSAEAERRTPYRLLTARLKTTEVYFREPPPGGAVSFLVRDGERPFLLLTEFRGQALPFLQKVVGPRTRVEQVRVDGHEGVWIEGAPHVLIYRDARGEIRSEERRRVLGNVLLWEQAGLTLRLEGPLGKEEALGIARSVR